MKKQNYILLLLMFLGLSVACENYLEKELVASNFLTEEDILQDRGALDGIVGRLYDTTEWLFEMRTAGVGGGARRNDDESGKNYGNINLLSGECISTWSRITIDALTLGDFRTRVGQTPHNPDFGSSWYSMWEAVYLANEILSFADRIPLTTYTEEERNQIKGEGYLFRALAYHEISKRWGPMPYFIGQIDHTSDFNIRRPTFAELTENIVKDCDSAFATLPRATWLNHAQYMGRIGKAGALALKSRALTTAASPNNAGFDPNNASINHFGNDPALWKQAADAALELINYAETESQVGLYQGDYNLIFHTSPGTIEGLWPRFYPQTGPNQYRISWFSRSQGGIYGLAPSQELIDRFEMDNGLLPKDDPEYNEQNPYVNRDPRFYKNIFYHGAPMFTTADGQTADFRTGPGIENVGVNRKDPINDSNTGYLVKKMVPENWNLINARNVPRFLNMPHIRMAEIYLNYAEAVNEISGPNGTAEGSSLTAVEAINTIRRRVGHVNVHPRYTTDTETFRELVRNEFRVELCFEYHTWFDLIRWRIAEDELHEKNFTQILIEADDNLEEYPTGFRFSRAPVILPRVFQARHYRYPILQQDLEVFEFSNILQNPGW